MPAAVSPYRVFAEKSYVTDFTSYATKEAATEQINILKHNHANLKLLARVVERKGGFVIYFEESSYKAIFGKLPPKPEGTGDGTPVKTAGKKVVKQGEKPSTGSAKPSTTKAPIKLAGAFGSEKLASKPSPADKGGTTKSPRKASARPPPEKRGPAPKQPEYYGPPPPYLLARMNRDAQKFYLAKDAEFERLPPKQVDKLLEIFNAELLKFDVKFEKERPVIGRIREIQGILNEKKRKIDDEIATRFLAEKVKAPLENGKFLKVLQKYDGSTARTVADAIIKEIGRGRKECPLSDYALGQEVTKILQEKYPGKYRD